MPSISLLLLTADGEYSSRLCRYFGIHHPELRISVLDRPENYEVVLSANACSVVLIGEEYANVPFSFSERVASAFLSENSLNGGENGRKVYCKYRSGETIYKMILGLYAEISAVSSDSLSGSTKIAVFVSANGGAGATTAAMAYANRLARAEKRVLYVSLDPYEKTSEYFRGENSGSMTDLIAAVILSEQRSINLSAKATSVTAVSEQGISFIESCAEPQDYEELNEDRLNALCGALNGSAEYERIIFDVPLHRKMFLDLLSERADQIYLISGSGKTAQKKLSRVADAIRTRDIRGASLHQKIKLIFNQGTSAREAADAFGFSVLGTAPRYKSGSISEIIEAFSLLEFWNSTV